MKKVSMSIKHLQLAHSAPGIRTRVAQVRAKYPNQLEYSGDVAFSDDVSVNVSLP